MAFNYGQQSRQYDAHVRAYRARQSRSRAFSAAGLAYKAKQNRIRAAAAKAAYKRRRAASKRRY